MHIPPQCGMAMSSIRHINCTPDIVTAISVHQYYHIYTQQETKLGSLHVHISMRSSNDTDYRLPERCRFIFRRPWNHEG